MTWTLEQVIAFAPDAGTEKRARGLANLTKWQDLSFNERALWGECKGSGSRNYQVRVDLNGPGYKCSCPSRKFPCKHTLALFLLFTKDKSVFQQEATPPDWVQPWLDQRSAKEVSAIKRELPKDEKALEKARLAKEKRSQERLERMKAGCLELEKWLEDIVRQGLAQLDHQPKEFWTSFAYRMTDAQLGGIAGIISNMANYTFRYADWPERILFQLGRLYMMAKGLKKVENPLAPEYAALLETVGWNRRKADILDEAVHVIKDKWHITGLEEGLTEDEQNYYRRVWLFGEDTEKDALLLDFAHVTSRFEEHYSVGNHFHGHLSYYPSTFLQRAVLADNIKMIQGIDFETDDLIEDVLSKYADALELNPWLFRFPVRLNDVLPFFENNAFYLKDKRGAILPLSLGGVAGWKLLALNPENNLKVVGEWDGFELNILSAFENERFVDVKQRLKTY